MNRLKLKTACFRQMKAVMLASMGLGIQTLKDACFPAQLENIWHINKIINSPLVQLLSLEQVVKYAMNHVIHAQGLLIQNV